MDDNPFLFLRAPCLTPQLPATSDGPPPLRARLLHCATPPRLHYATPPLRRNLHCATPPLRRDLLHCAIPLPHCSLPLPHCAIPLPLPHHAVSHFRSNSSSTHCAIPLPLPVFPTARTCRFPSSPVDSQRGGYGSIPARRPDNARITPARPKRGGRQCPHRPSASQARRPDDTSS
jgi:hypothetical protein